ncbi:MAG: alpha/beta hydrolase [Candidatus Omnitrophota bacterium]|jgi:pimeloyl-ACP methyl ester carboxylesterase
MKKLIVTVFASMVVVLILIGLSFLYIDLTKHKSFSYDILEKGKNLGSIKVDRYATEDKIIFRSKGNYPKSLKFPAVSEKLALRKRSLLPLRYFKESAGVKGTSQTVLLEQNIDRTDYLFLRYPEFFSVKEFETGHKTMVFSPYDVMLYMPIMEKYNLWKKGTQYFEVMVPLEDPVPIFRDKIGVKYLGDEYIFVMGRKVEAAHFAINAKGLPEAKVFMSKYTHEILSLEVPKKSLHFILSGKEDFLSRIARRFGSRPVGVLGKISKTPADVITRRDTRKMEVFFESENQILSGYLRMPQGKGPFPAAILVSKDGPMIRAEEALLDSYAEDLSSSGFAVLVFYKPGQGKSQGNFVEIDDEKRIRTLKDAVSYLKGLPGIKSDRISLIGIKGGGYLSLRTAQETPDVFTCVALGMPLESFKAVAINEAAKKEISSAMSENKIGPFSDAYMANITKIMRGHLQGVVDSAEGSSFFMGSRVPLKGYREFIARAPYEKVLSFDKPLLMIFGRKDEDFDPQITEKLKKALSEVNKKNVKVAVIVNLDGYMGTGVAYDDITYFEANKDALQLIKNWIAEIEQLSLPPPVVEEEPVVAEEPAIVEEPVVAEEPPEAEEEQVEAVEEKPAETKEEAAETEKEAAAVGEEPLEAPAPVPSGAVSGQPGPEE